MIYIIIFATIQGIIIFLKGELIMTHENARAGFKNLFTAEVLVIIAAVIDVVGVLLTLIPAAGLVIYGIVEIGSVVLVIIAFILQLVGLSKAGKDEPMIKSAFVGTLIALIASAVIPLIGALTNITWLNSLGDIVALVVSLYVTHHVLFGGANLNPSLTDKAQSTWRVYLATIIISLVLAIASIIVTAIGIVTLGAILLVALSVFAAILEIAGYVKYVGFLNAARNEV